MNIVLIIADTVRHDYCGCYGNKWVKTPNLDALAADAVLMENFFAGSFPTGPMRKDIFSGRFTFTYAAWQGDPPTGEPLLGKLLRDRGYNTAFVGDTGNSPQYRKGFQYEQVIPRTAANIDNVPAEVALPAAARKLRVPMQRITQIVRNAMGYAGETDRPVARTVRAAHRWLEQQRDNAEPFFLCVDTFDPHEPWDPPRYYIDLYDPDYNGDELMEPAYEPADYASAEEIRHMRCMYAAKLTLVDRWIGFLLDGLELMGLKQDTAVIFTSDHGFYHGEHNLIGKVRLDREGPICGRWPLYNTIAHPPLLIRVPGEPGNQRIHAFCQPPDAMATILDLAGITRPDKVQGRSLLPLIRGRDDSIRDIAVSSCTFAQDAEVRPPTCLRSADWLYVYGGDEWQTELYDLRSDPDEEHNVLTEHRDVAQGMHARLLEFLADIDCPADNLEMRQEFNPAPRPDLPHRKII